MPVALSFSISQPHWAPVFTNAAFLGEERQSSLPPYRHFNALPSLPHL